MPQLISSPSRIPVPGGKVIDEYVGRVTTGSTAASVAYMTAPSGWEEPAQTPEFDEITVVLRGTVHVEYDGGTVGRPGGALPGRRARPLHDPPRARSMSRFACPAFAREPAHRDDE